MLGSNLRFDMFCCSRLWLFTLKTIIFESDNLDSHSRGYSLFYSNKIFSDGVPSNSTEFVW